ncbi:MAG: hypothetical protein ACT4QG_15575 [Sporichthyaceae bacterium]
MFARRRPRVLDGALVTTAVGLALLAVYLPGSADPQAANASSVPALTDQPSVTPSALATVAPTAVPTEVAVAGPTKLAPGEKPPQFVVLSYDGAGSLDRWQFYRNLAKETGAGFTYYVGGTYLLPDAKKNAYRPPNWPVGYSEVGFGGTAADVRARMEHIRSAYTEGAEIGTHFNGHMCGAKGIAAFDTAAWRSEMEQWFGFLENWRTNADAPGAESMPFGRSAVTGARTPCLEGKRPVFLPVFEDNGFTYDTSGYGYLQWPRKSTSANLWDIPLQELRMAGTGRTVLSMDYNFSVLQGKVSTPASRFAMQRQMVTTYNNAFDAVYHGNRAPLIIGHHFAEWNMGVYHDAMAQFVRETCGRPEVRCVTFQDLVKWLDVQDPADIQKLRDLGVARMEY